MSGWRKCDTCRKVRPLEDFDGDSTTCRADLAAPAPRKRAAPVTRTRTATAPAAAEEPAARRPLLGKVGYGDTEVRERRAKRAAYEALAESHPEEFALLLRDARAREGLRAAAPGDGASGPEAASDQAADRDAD